MTRKGEDVWLCCACGGPVFKLASVGNIVVREELTAGELLAAELAGQLITSPLFADRRSGELDMFEAVFIFRG